VVATVAVLIWYRRWRLAIPLLLFLPVVSIALIENRRRVGILALWVALVVLIALAIRFESRMRKGLIPLTAVAVAGVALFMVSNWNHDTGTIGQVVRPVHSLFEPSSRDAQSDAYREAENANILFTYQTSPAIGIGFGRPMDNVFPMADISNIYPLWNYIPHNTLLWIGMRMGTLGYAVLFALLGIAILEATRQARTRADPLLRGVAAFAIVAIVAELMVAWGDLQLENYRNMIFLGTILGIIDALPRIPDAQKRTGDA
jgi:O-antigen ligase